jgi:hypothetical protein
VGSHLLFQPGATATVTKPWLREMFASFGAGAASDGTPLGETALMVAAQYGHADAVAILAAAGQLDVANEYGQRALHVASMFGRAAAARALLRAGASLEARDGDGATPLALAAEHGHRDCALELLWRGADADAADGAGATPRDVAAAAGRDDVAAMLAAWARGELRQWSRCAHPHLPPPFPPRAQRRVSRVVHSALQRARLALAAPRAACAPWRRVRVVGACAWATPP